MHFNEEKIKKTMYFDEREQMYVQINQDTKKEINACQRQHVLSVCTNMVIKK